MLIEPSDLNLKISISSKEDSERIKASVTQFLANPEQHLYTTPKQFLRKLRQGQLPST